MTDLIDLIKVGDYVAVESFLNDEYCATEQINSSNGDNRTAFETALACGYKNIALLLVNHEDFDFNTSSSNPLLATIKYGYIDIAEILLDKGANPNFRVQGSSSALVSVLEQEYIELAQKMVACGAEVNIRNEKGWTPLIWASIRGFKSIVEFLINNGADVHIVNNDGWNAVTGALFKNHKDIVSLLMENGAVLSHKFTQAALVKSYESGDKESALHLIGRGIDVNLFNENKKPLILTALEKGDFEFFKLLLKHGVDPNTLDSNSASLLLHSTRLGLVENAQLLLEHGADINLKSGVNLTPPIVRAASDNQLTMAEFLLKNGAFVNAQNKHGTTALHCAVSNKNIKMMKLLLEEKANPDVKNNEDHSSRYKAKQEKDSYKGDSQFYTLIQQYG